MTALLELAIVIVTLPQARETAYLPSFPRGGSRSRSRQWLAPSSNGPEETVVAA